MMHQNSSINRQLAEDFPILNQNISGHKLIYLDNAASTQKPQCVIDALTKYYEEYNANVHRGLHNLSQRATDAYEAARKTVQKFIHAKSEKEIVFVRGTTEAINLVAQTFGRANIQSGDEIIISAMEHHSNIVPWQILCEQVGAKLKVIPIFDNGELDIESYENMLSEKTKLVSIVHVSNAIGTINPVKEIVELAHQHNAKVLLDGAQAVAHLSVDVQELDCDFYAFSGHKMYGPMGIGVLYAKKELLDKMPPYQGGGEMIMQVSFEKSEFNLPPYKFEAGTPNVSGAIGLAAAINYLSQFSWNDIHAHEQALLQYATKKLQEIPGAKIIGTAKNKVAVISFTLDNCHPHDLGTILDQYGVAVRAGHHCTMPLMDRLKVVATTRASFGIYNTQEEIDKLYVAIENARKMFDV